jgi:uncharacterized protein YceK
MFKTNLKHLNDMNQNNKISHSRRMTLRKWLTVLLVISLSGCGSFSKDDDPSLGGTYSGCSFMSDVNESYTFNSNGTYDHYRDDRYGDGVSSEIGNWSTANDKITLQITQYSRNGHEFRDTTGWTKTQAFSLSNDGDCISIGYSDKYCKGGSCLN